MKLEELYTHEILALAAAIPHLGRLAEADGSATRHSRLCGSRVTVDVRLSGGRVSGFAQELSACALAQASAALLGRGVIGETPGGLRAARAALRAMLEEGAAAPGGRWSGLAVLAPVREVPARHASVLLPFEAACEALERAGHGRKD